jgi:hypothetical protein
LFFGLAIALALGIVARNNRVQKLGLCKRPVDRVTECRNLLSGPEPEANSVVIAANNTDIRVVATEPRAPKLDVAFKSANLPAVRRILAGKDPEPSVSILKPV